MAVLLLAFAGCQSGVEPVDKLEQAAQEPQELAGETVVVQGRVNRVLGDCAYELEDASLLSPDRVLTLCDPTGTGLPPPEVPANVQEGDWLRVTGVPGEMTREDYEYKTTLTLPEEIFGKTETRSVIFVASAKRVERPEGDDGRAELPKAPVVVPIL